jgi:hypothetical protein
VCGIDVALTVPIGEPPAGAYFVSTTDVVPFVVSPRSTFTTRPNPSSVFFVQCEFVVAVIVDGDDEDE